MGKQFNGQMADPDHLRNWLTERGMRRLVLRISDLMQLPERAQEVILGLIPGGIGPGSPRERLRQCCPTGYAVIPFETVCATQERAAEVQEIVLCYRELRMRMGDPEVVSACECGGRRRQCRYCGGSGEIRTVVELSDEELGIARAG